MKIANLRTCASCEWIFRLTEHEQCPKCNFESYGARYVYGNKAYRYEKTQQPWIKNKLLRYHVELLKQVKS